MAYVDGYNCTSEAELHRCVEVLHELCWPSQLAFEERASLMPGDS